MIDEETIRIYDEKAEDYLEQNETYSSKDPRLHKFIAECSAGDHVLDIGCGPATASRIMAENGLKPVAMDASAEMVDLASRQKGVEAVQGTFADLIKIAPDSYDAIWANFSLLHAPRSDMPHHLAAIKSALKPAGPFYIALKLGTGEARDLIGRLYTYYEEDELIDLLQAAGFSVEHRHYGQSEGLDGSVADWISVCCHG